MGFLRAVTQAITGVPNKSKEELEQELDEQIEVQQQQLEQQFAQEQQQEENQQEYGQVTFTVDARGNVNINVTWNSLETHIAEALGKLLFHIHEGNLQEQCEQILTKAAWEQPQARPFVRQLVDVWNDSIAADDPVIKPSQVFNSHQQMIGQGHDESLPEDSQ